MTKLKSYVAFGAFLGCLTFAGYQVPNSTFSPKYINLENQRIEITKNISNLEKGLKETKEKFFEFNSLNNREKIKNSALEHTTLTNQIKKEKENLKSVEDKEKPYVNKTGYLLLGLFTSLISLGVWDSSTEKDRGNPLYN